MNYKNYTIEPDNTGYASKNMTYGIYKDGESIERCETEYHPSEFYQYKN